MSKKSFFILRDFNPYYSWLFQVVQSGAQNIEIAVMKRSDVVSYNILIFYFLAEAEIFRMFLIIFFAFVVIFLFWSSVFALKCAFLSYFSIGFFQPGECTHRVLTVEEVEALMKVVEEEREAAEAEEASKKKP